jgi:transcriptional/translational regulatory protein YebC/TACO1
MEADVDVTDIENEDGLISVFTPTTEYAKARQALVDSFDGIEFEVDEIQYLAQNPAALTEADDIEKFELLLALLNDNDDVQSVYHSAVM